eukprot:TRINITY_DN75050_c0_g1_i1.p1 TRINITY_DN75050_c0_g1~~TRINITY_DN75050_c0_g1_i1.p1  ORF type:complete len:848 (+),score=169.50 TRINITY_DN75050_c0_g1_i1:75-2618(+)
MAHALQYLNVQWSGLRLWIRDADVALLTRLQDHWSVKPSKDQNNSAICTFDFQYHCPKRVQFLESLLAELSYFSNDASVYYKMPQKTDLSSLPAFPETSCAGLAIVEMDLLGLVLHGWSAPPALEAYIEEVMPCLKKSTDHCPSTVSTLQHLMQVCQQPGKYSLRPALARCRHYLAGYVQDLFAILQFCGFELQTVDTDTRDKIVQQRTYTFSPSQKRGSCAKLVQVLRTDLEDHSRQIVELVASLSEERCSRAREHALLRQEVAELTAARVADVAQLGHLEEQLKQLSIDLARERKMREDADAAADRRQDQHQRLEDSWAQEREQMRQEAAALHVQVSEANAQAAQRAIEPKVRMKDVDGGDGVQTRYILIECPGVGEADVEIEALPNGVGLHIDEAPETRSGLPARSAFDREFCFADWEHGRFELRMDECRLDDGVLYLVLKRMPRQKLKLRSFNGSAMKHTILEPVPEASEIARHCIGSHGAVSESEGGSSSVISSDWVPVASLIGATELTDAAAERSVPAVSTSAAAEEAMSCSSEAAMTAPISISSCQCFVSSAQVLMADGALVPMAGLQPGDRLRSAVKDDQELSFAEVSVKSLRKLPGRDRDIATLNLTRTGENGGDCSFSLVVTADHSLLSRRQDASTWQATHAAELRSDSCSLLGVAAGSDHSQDHEIQLAGVSIATDSCEVLDLELEDCAHMILLAPQDFATSGDSNAAVAKNLFVLAFGCPPRGAMIVECKGSFLEARDFHDDDNDDCITEAKSDPTHAAHSVTSWQYCIIHAPHSSSCKAFCRHNFEGKCKAGFLCRWCHHPSHYENRTSPPAHRGKKKGKKGQDDAKDAKGSKC